MTVEEWMAIARTSPGNAYAQLLYRVRRKEATIAYAPPRGLWGRHAKWARRLRTEFNLIKDE